MYRYYGIIRAFTGPGLATTSVTVYSDAAGTVVASLYDSVGGGIANPTTTNSRGAIDVYSPLSQLWYKVAGDTVVQPLPMYSFGPGITNVMDYGAHGNGTDDDVAHIQAAIDACGTNGGYIVFPAGGVYLINATRLKLPPNLNAPLVLSGYGATFKLAAMYPVFWLFKGADDDTFRHIILEGFTIDATGLVINGELLIVANDSTNINIEDIVIRDIVMTNITNPVSPNGCGGLSLKSEHGHTGGAWHHVQDILVENVRMEGGTCLMYIGGGSVHDENILVDRITVRNCYHDTGEVRESWVFSLNAQFGGNAKCGSLLVDGFYGAGAGDVGIEVNCWDDAVIRNATIENAFGFGFYSCAYGTYLNRERATTRFEDCTYKRTAGGTGWQNQGFRVTQHDSYGLGHIVYDRCAYLNNCGVWDAALHYDAICVESGTSIKSLTVRNFIYAATGVVWPVNIYGGAIRLDPTGPCQLTVDGYKFHVDGERTAGATSHQFWALIIGGTDVVADIRNVYIDFDVTNLDQYGGRGVVFGFSAGATLDSASIRNLFVSSFSDDTSPTAIAVSNNVTVAGLVHISGCDFAAAPAGVEEFAIGSANASKVLISDHTWRNVPAPAAFTTKVTLTIDSVSTHATLPEIVTGAAHGMVAGDWVAVAGIAELPLPYYQVVSTDAATHFVVSGTTTGTDTGTCQPCYINRDGYAEDVVVSGGTVTAIALSSDAGATFTVTGLTAGIFGLRGGDIIHITNSAAPTTTKLPKP